MMGQNLSVDFWESSYQDGRTGWDRGETHPALLSWIERERLRPCRIAVPGCGNGHEVISLAEHGFDVTAIDFATQPIDSLIKKLSALNLESDTIHGDLFNFKPAEPFDAVYEQTCLCAIEPSLRNLFEKQIHDWLRPGGTLYALFMQVPHANEGSPAEGPPFQGPPFDCDILEMKRLFPSDRWLWHTDPEASWDHPSGKINELSFVLTCQKVHDIG